MLLRLGDRAYDLTVRPLVLATTPAPGADLVEVEAAAVPAAARAHAVPVVATVTGADDVGAAHEGGAVAVADLSGLTDAATVEATAAAGMALVGILDRDLDAAALVERARVAEASGMPPGRILLAPVLPARPDMLATVRRLATLGYPLVYSTGTDPTPAALATAVTGGCRIVRTSAVRSARRVCDVLAAVLEAGP